MDTDYGIHSRHSVGNLHIKLTGVFSGKCAWELFKTIRWQSTGSGRIFVDTANLNSVSLDGADLFKSHMGRVKLPSDWLYFKGQKGFDIAPDGSRVIVSKAQAHLPVLQTT